MSSRIGYEKQFHHPNLTKEQVYFRRRLGAAMLAGLVVAGGFLGLKKGVEAIKGEPKPSAEEKMVGNWLEGKDLPKVERGRLVLHAGVKLREAPETRDVNLDGTGKSNVTDIISEGEAYVIDDPLLVIKTDRDGREKEWRGFFLDDPKDNSFDASNPKETARRIVWINMTDIDAQRNTETGERFIEFTPAADTVGNQYTKESTAVQLQNGRLVIGWGPHNGEQVAVATRVAASRVDAVK